MTSARRHARRELATVIAICALMVGLGVLLGWFLVAITTTPPAGPAPHSNVTVVADRCR